MKEIKKIGILCPYSFPEGMAPTTRIIAYGKGLVQNGVDVEVFSDGVFLSSESYEVSGDVQGVKYTIPSFYNPKLYSKKLYRIFYAHFRRLYRTIRSIANSNKHSRFDVFLFSFDGPRELLFYGIIMRIMGIPVSFIGDEFPEPIRQLKKKVPLSQIIVYKLAYHFIRMRIVMTSALREFYDSKVSQKPTYILSSVVDCDRFLKVRKQRTSRKYMCYMGNMMLAKDNVDNIIVAFASIADDFPDIDLFLYGTPSTSDVAVVEECIRRNSMQKRVIIKGRASYSEVPQILANAEILVTSQPATKRAQGGFPTKMCEYMLSGVPAVLTDVGEIHEYVADGDMAYLVPPCNHKAYAEKLSYILLHYEEANTVAVKAKEYVLNTFGSKMAAKGLIDFLSYNI